MNLCVMITKRMDIDTGMVIANGVPLEYRTVIYNPNMLSYVMTSFVARSYRNGSSFMVKLGKKVTKHKKILSSVHLR